MVKHGCSNIEECIEKEVEKRNQGGRIESKMLEKMKRINTAVEENKVRREFFSRMT